MSTYFKYLVIAFTLLNVVGCTTYSEARKQLVDSLPESERSYLVGKFSVQCEPNNKGTKCNQLFNSISVDFKGSQLKHNDRFNSTIGSMFGNDTTYDKIAYDKKYKSYYFCRILPAGKYSLFTIRYWNFAGGGSGYYLSKEDQFDIPFILETGKISTIEHLKLTTDKGENIFGMPLPTPGILEISRLEKDEIQLAIQKCPEVSKNNEVLPQYLWKKDYESPFVQTKN